mmetsp:Transcript_17060/g.30442  ORF Transcript_17060/g.30442 Transcript_17060/m.30442 type:complete len:89 (+) Transcript_17060:121-387(+)
MNPQEAVISQMVGQQLQAMQQVLVNQLTRHLENRLPLGRRPPGDKEGDSMEECGSSDSSMDQGHKRAQYLTGAKSTLATLAGEALRDL